MNNYTIYCLTNSANGKQYIGQTNNWKRRWSDHRKSSCDSVISRAIRKHGKASFTVRFLAEGLTLEDANVREQRLIESMSTIRPNGYNVAEGGSNGNSLAGFSDEQMEAYRRKQSKNQKGKKQSDETKRKHSERMRGDKNPNWGKTTSPETRQKLSDANKGKTLSAETKHKIGEASKGNKHNLGRKLSDEHKRKIGEEGKGRVVSVETRAKFSKIHKGKIISSEMRCRISESLKGRKRPELSGDKNPMSTANRDKRRGQLRLFD